MNLGLRFCAVALCIAIVCTDLGYSLTQIEPYLVVTPNVVKVNENEMVILTCQIQLADYAHYLRPKLESLHWTCPQRQCENLKLHKDLAQASSTLTTQHATVDMAGNYTCVYIEGELALKASVKVTVESLSKTLKLSIFPNETKKIIQIKKGESIQINCTVNKYLPPPFKPFWSKFDNSTLEQEEVSNTSTTLVIRNAQESSAGQYKCMLNGSHALVKYLIIRVGNHGQKCVDTQFLCERQSGQHCIFHRYRCDGNEDCLNGEDEKDCSSNACKSNFQCHNGKCIDRSLVCDTHHANDCGDWSDEYCIFSLENSKNTPLVDLTKFNGTSLDQEISADSIPLDEISWLKTTGYTIIACTISIVFFITITVVILFKKRKNRQRALRRQRNDFLNNNPTNNDVFGRHSRTLEQFFAENEPFLNPAAFGSIIVNVNNGIQYVPGANFTIMDAPPSYSEVQREIQNGAIDPPPEYSTIDRNPVRSNPHRPASHRTRRHSRGQRSRHVRTSEANRIRPQMQHVSVQTSRSQTAQAQNNRNSGHPISSLDSNNGEERSNIDRECQGNSSKHGNILVQEGKIILSSLEECARLTAATANGGIRCNSNVRLCGGRVGTEIPDDSDDSSTGNCRPVSIQSAPNAHSAHLRRPVERLSLNNNRISNSGLYSSQMHDYLENCDSVEDRPARQRNRFNSDFTGSEASLTTNLPNSDPESCDNYSTITTCNLSMVCQPPSSPMRTSFSEPIEPLGPMLPVNSESSLQVEVENISDIDMYQGVSSVSSVESVVCDTDRHPELVLLESPVLLVSDEEDKSHSDQDLTVEKALCRSEYSGSVPVALDRETDENDFLLDTSGSGLNDSDSSIASNAMSDGITLGASACDQDVDKKTKDQGESFDKCKGETLCLSEPGNDMCPVNVLETDSFVDKSVDMAACPAKSESVTEMKPVDAECPLSCASEPQTLKCHMAYKTFPRMSSNKNNEDVQDTPEKDASRESIL